MFEKAMLWILTICLWMLAAGFFGCIVLFCYGLIRELYGIYKERHMRNKEWKEHDWQGVVMFATITFFSTIAFVGLALVALKVGRNLV